eukprot:Skav214845  [mRNA]  locus=scaffold16:75512:83756:+ [translate_table: standard]
MTQHRAAASLEVREHPKAGIFVEGLTRSVASSAEEVHRLVEFGHKIRVVGSTNMNARSSRSHAIVTLHLQVLDSSGSVARHAQLHAVDLAGAERLFMVGSGWSIRRQRFPSPPGEHANQQEPVGVGSSMPWVAPGCGVKPTGCWTDSTTTSKLASQFVTRCLDANDKQGK